MEKRKTVEDNLVEVIKNEIKEVKEESEEEEKGTKKELEQSSKSPPSKRQKLGPKKRKVSENTSEVTNTSTYVKSKNQQTKRKINEANLMILRSAFKKHANPSPKRVNKLFRKTDMTPEHILRWFARERSKVKKEKKKTKDILFNILFYNYLTTISPVSAKKFKDYLSSSTDHNEYKTSLYITTESENMTSFEIDKSITSN
jgi:hypothetical protein